MFELREAAELFGMSLPAAALSSDVAFLEFIKRGLSLKILERLSSTLAPSDADFKYRIVPKATLARVKSARRRLSATQSVLLARLASVWTLAVRVWKSDEAARAFLFRAHPVLDQRRPIDLVLENEIGADLVRGLLGRLESGTAV